VRSTTFGIAGGPRPQPRRKRAPLSECIELTAAYLVIGPGRGQAVDLRFKRKLLTVSRRELHAAVERILLHVPGRRVQ
jgi:hypothetical protein